MISFERFFARVHNGAQPYDWQQRFAAACLEGRPPAVVAVPTGAGKTGVLDALVWALAKQADLPASERTVGARIVWAIDRRILVDQVYGHAKELAEALRDALKNDKDELSQMASRLVRLSSSEDTPLEVTRWRGGLERDDEPLLAPTQPQVITSTVAQIGSRLLYRGYGVGRRSLSLQAGLAGCDVNICLDEAHLARPFAETIAAVRHQRAGASGDVSLPPLNAITLSATPGDSGDEVLALSDRDREQLGVRYSGEKLVALDDSAPQDAARAKRIAEIAHEHLGTGAKRVACVVNTVRQALSVHSSLAKGQKKGDYDLALLIGPQRPYDREKTLRGPFHHLLDGTEPERPVVCVATQTFEVGLDADVEVLVTESAAADALVQRFGRLNRSGKWQGRATVVRAPDSWLYGEDEEAAWAWLEARVERHGGDISVAALEHDEERPALRRVTSAPELRADVVERLVQTNPRPGAFQDPDVEPYIAGAESEPENDVAFCWRCDLRLSPTEDAPIGDPAYRSSLLALAPPVEGEKLSLGLHAARAFLAALYPSQTTKRVSAMRGALDEADVEGPSARGKTPPIGTSAGTPFVVLRQRECLEGTLTDTGAEGCVGPGELKPGDTVVLPEMLDPVRTLELMRHAPRAALDVAPDLHSDAEPSDLRCIRISPEALGRAMAGESAVSRERWHWVAALCRKAESKGDRAAVDSLVRELGNGLPGHASIPRLAERVERGMAVPELVRVGDPSAAELGELEELLVDGPGDGGEGAQRESDDPTSVSGEDEPQALPVGPTWVLTIAEPRDRRAEKSDPPTLESHARAVRERVEAFSEPLGLPQNVRAALVYAARVHDHGKADRRIQAFYNDGLPSLGRPLRAKSVFGTGDRTRSQRAARLAGLPQSLRHEVASTAIAASSSALATAPDLPDSAATTPYLDLALHLVGTHHGCNRPFPTVPRGGDPAQGVFCDVDGVAGSAASDGVENWLSGEPLERFLRVVQHFGPWATSYLEAILILADRSVSREGR